MSAKTNMLVKIQQQKERKANKDSKLIENSDEKILNIPVTELQDNPFQPRLAFDEIKMNELMMSIKESGLIQPIPVASYLKNCKQTYILIAGHRRVEAHKRLGLNTIKCIITSNPDDMEMASMAIIENLQRHDLEIIELALQYKKLLDLNIFKNTSALANAIGRNNSSIGKTIKLLTLSQDIINDLQQSKSTSDLVALDAIRKIQNQETQEEIYFWFINEKVSRADLLNKIKSLNPHKNQILTPLIIKETSSGTHFIINTDDKTKLEEIEKAINQIL